MEQGDKFGLVGMILGLEGVISIISVLFYIPMMSIPALIQMEIAIVYISVLGGGTVGIILSIIGIAKNKSKFGIIGLIFASLAYVIFILFFVR